MGRFFHFGGESYPEKSLRLLLQRICVYDSMIHMTSLNRKMLNARMPSHHWRDHQPLKVSAVIGHAFPAALTSTTARGEPGLTEVCLPVCPQSYCSRLFCVVSTLRGAPTKAEPPSNFNLNLTRTQPLGHSVRWQSPIPAVAAVCEQNVFQANVRTVPG